MPVHEVIAVALVAALATACSSATPHVAFAVKESAITKVTGPALVPDAPTELGAAEAAPAAPAARPADEILATCVPDGKKGCALGAAAADELCRSMTPTTALHVFANNKKLRLAYLTHDMETWSTRHGRQTKARARFDEEVMVLSKRVSKSGIVMQGASATYEVLRWDGTCASLMSDELTFRRAPRPVRPVRVDRLQLTTQAKLLDDGRIHAAAERADAACSADDKIACDVARRAFGDLIVTRGPKLGL